MDDIPLQDSTIMLTEEQLKEVVIIPCIDEHQDKEVNELDDLDVASIYGDPHKTALCFPKAAELNKLNWRALIFGVLWWLVCFYINCVVQVTTEHIENRTYPMSQESDFVGRHTFYSESYMLFDLGFFLFPPLPNLIADICAYGFVAITLIRFLLTRNRFVILKRYTLILGTIFLFRAITIVSTILPQPQRECMATATGNPFLDSLMILLVQKKTCTDMFFSGHATNIALVAWLWTRFSHLYPVIPSTRLDKILFRGRPLMDRYGRLKRPTLVKILVWLFTFVSFFFISATRLHYVIDIIFGFFVTSVFFLGYHHALSKACMNNSLFSRFIRWFDSDSPEIELGRRLVKKYPFLHVDAGKDHDGRDSVVESRIDSKIDTSRIDASAIDTSRIDASNIEPSRIESSRIESPKLDGPGHSNAEKIV